MEEVDMGTNDHSADLYERNVESVRVESTETTSQHGKRPVTSANSTTEYPSSDLSNPKNSTTKRSRSAKEQIAEGDSISSNPGDDDAAGATKIAKIGGSAGASTVMPSTTVIAPEAGGSDLSANIDSEQSEQIRLEERRAYNRRNAARSRQRVKDQLRDLQQQVLKQSTTTQELERANVRLVAENSVLRDEVNKLRSIISGTPLLGPQPQSLQPFLQQLPFSSSTAPLSSQTTTHGQNTLQIPTSTAAQQLNSYMLQNPNLQQQQLHSTVLPHTSSFPQVATSQPSSNITPSDAGSDINQQNQMMQLLLQHLISGGSAINPMFPAHEQLQLGSVQQQQQQIHQQQQQQDQQASFAAFMALLGGKGNTGPSLQHQQGMPLTLGEQSFPFSGGMVSTQSIPQPVDPPNVQQQLPTVKPEKTYESSSSQEDDSASDGNYDEEG
jgi:hypothetical protein